MKLSQSPRPPTLPTRRWARNRFNMAVYVALALGGGVVAVLLGLALIVMEASGRR